MYQNPMNDAKLPKRGIPTNGNMRLPIRWATFSGMAAAPASSRRAASVSRSARNFRSSSSRFSASRERRSRSFCDPVLSSLTVGCSCWVDTDVDDVDSVERALLLSIDGVVFGFETDFSPKPFPADSAIGVCCGLPSKYGTYLDGGANEEANNGDVATIANAKGRPGTMVKSCEKVSFRLQPSFSRSM